MTIISGQKLSWDWEWSENIPLMSCTDSLCFFTAAELVSVICYHDWFLSLSSSSVVISFIHQTGHAVVVAPAKMFLGEFKFSSLLIELVSHLRFSDSPENDRTNLRLRVGVHVYPLCMSLYFRSAPQESIRLVPLC